MAWWNGKTGARTTNSATWNCVKCGAVNAGARPAGCTRCKAGANARTGERTAPELALPAPAISAGVPDGTVGNLPTDEALFEQWWKLQGGTLDRLPARDLARAAYLAGWREGIATPAPTTPKPDDGPWSLQMVSPATKETQTLDRRTVETIVAALEFYRDNQLAFGPMPGQLTAMEVSALLKRLIPKESEE